MPVRKVISVVAMILLLAPQAALTQAPSVDRELEEAKALYREAKFTQAIVKLQRAIGQIEQLQEVQARKAQLADAHLHLGSSLVALNDPAAAKESFRALVRIDPARKLDPDVYAPKVIELFEQARAEVAGEPKPVASAPVAAAASGAAKKGGSKAVPILLGAAAVTGGAVALAGRSGKSGSSAGSTTAASPSPAPTLTGTNDVALVSTLPPAGSTFGFADRQASCGNHMCFTIGYTSTASRACLEITLLAPTGCEAGKNGMVVEAGTSRTVSIGLNIATGCGLPVDLPKLRVRLGAIGPGQGVECNATSSTVEKLFDVNYHATR